MSETNIAPVVAADDGGLTSWKTAELKKFLAEHDVPFPSNANKAALLKLAQTLADRLNGEDEAAEVEETEAVEAETDAETDAETEAENETEAESDTVPDKAVWTDKTLDETLAEQALSDGLIVAEYDARKVAEATGFPFEVEVRNATATALAFPELGSGNQAYFHAFSGWQSVRFTSRNMVETFAVNLRYLAELNGWQGNVGVFLRKKES